jgi:hypothetical protein
MTVGRGTILMTRGGAMSEISKKVRALTGARTRIVWPQQQQGSSGFEINSDDYMLKGFDTEDNRGERSILERVGSFASPMITPGGERIVYTSIIDEAVHVVNWDGTDDHVFVQGYAVALWRDPAEGTDWVYVRPNVAKSWHSKSMPVVRHRLDDPSVQETVWTRSAVNWNWFSLSHDGTRAACVSPWPKCGMGFLKSQRLRQFDKGCWTSMAPDNSCRMWVFDWNHRDVKLYDKKGVRLAVIDLHGGPGINGWEVYHPRWSNNVRIVTVTGPYSRGRTDWCRPEDMGNWIPEGGRNVEVYVGRLDAECTKVEQWVKVTGNDKADFQPDVWVEPAAA